MTKKELIILVLFLSFISFVGHKSDVHAYDYYDYDDYKYDKVVLLNLGDSKDFVKLREDVEWESSDEDIVSIDSFSFFADYPGKAIIKAILKETGKRVYWYKVIVKTPVYKIKKKNIKLKIGSKKQLNLYEKNGSSVYNDINWESSNEYVATVNSDGILRARAEGSTIVTAEICKKKYKFQITVEKKNPSFSEVYKEMKAFEKRNNRKVFKCGKKYGRAILMCGGQYNFEYNRGRIYIKRYEIDPFIELTKKNGKTVIKYKYFIEYTYNSPNYYFLTPKNFYIYSDSFKLKVDEFEISKRSHELFQDCIYMNKLRMDAIVLSTESSQEKIEKKIWILDNVFTGSGLGSKITLTNENGMHAKFLNERKKYYIKLYNFYKKLLKMYM